MSFDRYILSIENTLMCNFDVPDEREIARHSNSEIIIFALIDYSILYCIINQYRVTGTWLTKKKLYIYYQTQQYTYVLVITKYGQIEILRRQQKRQQHQQQQ